MINPRNPHHMMAVGKVRQGGMAPFWTHYDAVKIFHEACQRAGLQYVGDIREASFSKELLKGRIEIIDEEVNKELLPALWHAYGRDGFITLEQKAEILDHIVDSVYVLFGLAVALGLPFNEGFYLVQTANMNKIGMNGPEFWEEGNPEGQPVGKLKKPEGWTPPPMFDLIKEFYTNATIQDEHQRGKMPVRADPSEQLPGQSGNLQ